MTSINDVLKASKGLLVDDIFAELWGRKLSGDYTIEVYTGTLPATLTRTRAGYLHRYKVYGNLTQNGTPTPSDPIVPSECGERTENLADENQLYPCYLTQEEGYFRLSMSTSRSYILPCTGDTVYTFQVTSITAKIGFFSAYPQENDLSMSYTNFSTPDLHTIDKHTLTITSPSTASYVVFFVYNTSIEGNLHIPIEDILATVMVVEDSTAPTSYIPYGYKLPLLSGSTPVEIYLGESQTTRWIKKLAFDGTENWRIDSGRFTFRVTDIKSQGLRRTRFYCSSYQVISDGREYADVPNNAIYTGGGDSSGAIVYIHTDEYTDTTSFKAYLAQQYSNGTPVTIWYPLMTPTTGIVNEPLRKIGDYADTIDSTQTSAQIPTTAGSTTISWAGSGLAPSQVELTYERK